MTTPFPADDSVGSNCKSCGAAITPTAKFCLKCGAPQVKPMPTTIPCGGCGFELPVDAKFCEKCGASQSPQQDVPVTSDTSEPFAHPHDAEAEPDGWRLPSLANAKEDETEPKQSSGLLKIVLICGALVLAIVLAGTLVLDHRDTGIAHFKRGEALKDNGDYMGAKQELDVCLSECKGWEKNTAREELERIEPLIAGNESSQHNQVESPKNHMQQQTDWVAQHLDGYVFSNLWQESPGSQSEMSIKDTMTVNAQIVDECSLKLTATDDTKGISVSYDVGTIDNSDTKLCSVSLSKLSSQSFAIKQLTSLSTNEHIKWDLSINDKEAVSCEITRVDGEGVRTVAHAPAFFISFLGREGAEAWLTDFKAMVHDNCSSQSNPPVVQQTQNTSTLPSSVPPTTPTASSSAIRDAGLTSRPLEDIGCPNGSSHPAPKFDSVTNTIRFPMACMTGGQFTSLPSMSSYSCPSGWKMEIAGHGFDWCYKPASSGAR